MILLFKLPFNSRFVPLDNRTGDGFRLGPQAAGEAPNVGKEIASSAFYSLNTKSAAQCLLKIYHSYVQHSDEVMFNKLAYHF